MASSQNIQAQLDKLKASLDPSQSTPVYNKTGYVIPNETPTIQASVKRYWKYALFGFAVVVIVVVFLKRRKAMLAKSQVPRNHPLFQNQSHNNHPPPQNQSYNNHPTPQNQPYNNHQQQVDQSDDATQKQMHQYYQPSPTRHDFQPQQRDPNFTQL